MSQNRSRICFYIHHQWCVQIMSNLFATIDWSYGDDDDGGDDNDEQ